MNLLAAMPDWVFAVLIIGATPLAFLAIAFIGWLEERIEESNWKKTCPICQQGDGVLLNDRSDLPTYRWTGGWCPQHRDRINRIRKLERELLDLPGPDQYLDGNPMENLVKKIQAWDGTPIVLNPPINPPVDELDMTILNMPVQKPTEPGAASQKEGGIR